MSQEHLSLPELQGFQVCSPLHSPRQEELLVIEVSDKVRQEDTKAKSANAAQFAASEMEFPNRKLEEEGVIAGERAEHGGSERGEGDEKPAPPLLAVSCFELFRFADRLDYVLMAIGTAGAIIHGCSLPVFLRFFADLVDSFDSNANNADTMVREVIKVCHIHHLRFNPILNHHRN
ncbi:ABC transporter B family member 1 [Dendrobium catenatum]|uniref:ABC transporter B family member 1 n=1 Tax=Dendrobium catenatum TaxID=906689 RepID=A0A2I0WDG5_9ASPA|nr:ABC transporter B family member 1 [Dendrobium catenatum]